MSDLPVGWARAEAEWLQPPDEPEPISVRISAWVSVFADIGKSPEECIREQIHDRTITIEDLCEIEVDEIDGQWPSDGSEW